MADSLPKEENVSMTEYESERERLANVLDIIMLIREAKAEGKNQYSADEMVEFLLNYAADIKRHK